MFNPSTQSAENEENITTRKIEKLIIVSSRDARLHPEQKGRKRRKREGRMATDERYQSSHPNRLRNRVYLVAKIGAGTDENEHSKVWSFG